MKALATRLCAAAALCLAAMPGAAQPAPAKPAPPPQKQLTTTLAFPDGVTLHGDITYATQRGYRPLTLDLYLPKSRTASPLVIFVHGGAWMGGTARSAEIAGDDFPAMFARLASKGYAVASISYRLAGEVRFPAPVQDLNAAIGFLRRNAAEYRIDGERIVLWGASAGAQIAMVTALDCREHALDPSAKEGPSTCVSAVVDWFGPTDLLAGGANPITVAYLGCGPADCRSKWEQAGVLTAVKPGAPPFLIVHGDADTIVPLAQSQSLMEALKTAAVPVELKVVPGGNHLFNGASRPEIDAAIERTFSFVDEQTKGH